MNVVADMEQPLHGLTGITDNEDFEASVQRSAVIAVHAVHISIYANKTAGQIVPSIYSHMNRFQIKSLIIYLSAFRRSLNSDCKGNVDNCVANSLISIGCLILNWA